MGSPPLIRFVSGNANERPNQATQTMVRSHAMSEVRRRQRQSKQFGIQERCHLRVQKDYQSGLRPCLPDLREPQGILALPELESMAQKAGEHFADSSKKCPKCGKVQFLKLSPSGQYELLNRYFPSITNFVSADFDPFGAIQMPELPGGRLSVADTQELSKIKAHAITFCSPGSIKSAVLPEAMKNPVLCIAMLYMSYAYMASMSGWSNQYLALAMKTAAIREINTQLADQEAASRTVTIASIIYLSTGSWAFGAAPDEVAAHKSGMELLVKQRGIESFSNIPFEETIRKYLVMHHTIICGLMVVPTSPVFRYNSDAASNLSRVMESQESPFYCPTDRFTRVGRSKRCSKEVLQILYITKELLNLLLDKRDPEGTLKLNRRIISVSSDLKSFEPAHNPESGNYGDYYFECCRLTALITLQAIEHSMPFDMTSKELTLQLMAALEKTDIGSCWGDMLGLLYWISLTGSAASQGRPGHRILDSTLGRTMFQMTFTIKDFECAIQPAIMLGKIQFALRDSRRAG